MKIKVISFNIHKGFSNFNRQFTLPGIRSFLREQKADLILLQEIVGTNTRHQELLAAWPPQGQTEFLAKPDWPHFYYGKNAVYHEPPHHRHHGNALLSRFPVTQSENINISNNRFEQRGLMHARVALSPQKNIEIFNVHLDLTEKGRQKQIQKIIQHGKTAIEPESALLITGDFNDWRQNATLPLQQELKVAECFEFLHGTSARSFPSLFPILPLDRIYFRGLKVISARVLSEPRWRKLSDHLPLYVEFETEEFNESNN